MNTTLCCSFPITMENVKEEKENGPCFSFNIGGWQIGDSNRIDDCSEDMLFNDKELAHFRSVSLEEALAF